MLVVLTTPMTAQYFITLLLVLFIPLLNVNEATKPMVGSFIIVVMAWMIISTVLSVIAIILLKFKGSVRMYTYDIKIYNIIILSATIILGLSFLDKPSFIELLAVYSFAAIWHLHTYGDRSLVIK